MDLQVININVDSDNDDIGDSGSALLQLFDILRLGLATKPIIQQTSDYLFMVDSIATYNDHVCVVAPYNIGFSCSVNADKFYKLLMSFVADVSSSSDVVLSIDSKRNQLVVTCSDNHAFGLSYCEPGPVFDVVAKIRGDYSDVKWKRIQRGLLDALILCSFYASKDMTNLPLTGVCVEGKRVMSSDKYRISSYTLDKYERRFLLPASACMRLNTIFTHYIVTDEWVHFATNALCNGVVMSIKQIKTTFPTKKVASFFPSNTSLKNNNTTGVVIPKRLAVLADRVAVLVQEDSVFERELSLSFNRGFVICTAKKEGVGWLRETVPLDTVSRTFTKFDVTINAAFLKEIFKQQRDIELVYVDDRRVLFVAEQFKHLISLV